MARIRRPFLTHALPPRSALLVRPFAPAPKAKVGEAMERLDAFDRGGNRPSVVCCSDAAVSSRIRRVQMDILPVRVAHSPFTPEDFDASTLGCIARSWCTDGIQEGEPDHGGWCVAKPEPPLRVLAHFRSIPHLLELALHPPSLPPSEGLRSTTGRFSLHHTLVANPGGYITMNSTVALIGELSAFFRIYKYLMGAATKHDHRDIHPAVVNTSAVVE